MSRMFQLANLETPWHCSEILKVENFAAAFHGLNCDTSFSMVIPAQQSQPEYYNQLTKSLLCDGKEIQRTKHRAAAENVKGMPLSLHGSNYDTKFSMLMPWLKGMAVLEFSNQPYPKSATPFIIFGSHLSVTVSSSAGKTFLHNIQLQNLEKKLFLLC